ncbi:hypothetical protein BPOR_0052g00210 [Botrytis porri]|uniref:Uncharacterized protein n=1 Tax=Botrytis porri TaxID=87229 RepID=A0A4Z1L1S0_9HELO|nr:hypothetical protein BPOR_0052g00210 [Botrytis porri]
MKSQEVSNKGQPQFQPVKVEQPETAPKTNPATSKKEPAKPDPKNPTTPRNERAPDFSVNVTLAVSGQELDFDRWDGGS